MMNKQFHDIFEATRYLQAQEGEPTTSISTLSRVLDLSVDEIAETVEMVGETLLGVIRAGRTITALFVRVQ